MKRGGRGEEGAALLLALVVLVLTATTGMLLATALSIDLRERREETRRSRTSVLLDSAVAEALASLREDPDSRGVAPRPFGGGEIGSEIRRLPDGSLELTATARRGPVARQVHARAVFGPYGPRLVAWQAGPAR
ncbi:MAG: hypothetical protein AB7G12_05345 [Thermoanaerobaculia bacterium]